jgi:hypothetical protein
MTGEIKMGATPEIANIDELVNRRIEELLPQKIEEALRQREESRTPSMAIIATKGTLDWGGPIRPSSSARLPLRWAGTYQSFSPSTASTC